MHYHQYQLILKLTLDMFSSRSGKGGSGQLGHGNLDNLSFSTFTKVEGFDGQTIVQVAAGAEHTVVLTSTGCVYTFGSNEYGQTGHGITEGNHNTPKKVAGCLESKKVVFVAANNDHSACITENGDTFTWGYGEYGSLGHGDGESRSTPKVIDGLVGKKAIQVACGWCHTIVCTSNGRVYSFGDGEYGQLGHGDSKEQWTPTLIEALSEGKFVVKVACGWSHSMALTSEGRLYTWGSGVNGKLGHGSELNSGVPSVVESLLGYKVVHIASKNAHSVALVDSKRSYSVIMKSMIDDKTCSDVTFVLKDGERIHANKGLLIARSKYFRAMFRSGMKESRENEVKVQDCSKGVFGLLLEYLYSGDVYFKMDDALELYALSDRYQEDDLSRKCLEAVRRGLSDANALELLVEADALGLIALKDVCMEYVALNEKLIEKDNIELLSHSLTTELLCNIVERRR